MPVENSAVLRRVGWEPAFGPAGWDSACRNSEETLAEQQAYRVLYRRSPWRMGAAKLAKAELTRIRPVCGKDSGGLHFARPDLCRLNEDVDPAPAQHRLGMVNRDYDHMAAAHIALLTKADRQ